MLSTAAVPLNRPPQAQATRHYTLTQHKTNTLIVPFSILRDARRSWRSRKHIASQNETDLFGGCSPCDSGIGSCEVVNIDKDQGQKQTLFSDALAFCCSEMSLTSEGARTPSRMSALNLDLELLRNTLNGAGIFPGLESLKPRGTSTRQGVAPHAMDSRSGFTIGPMLVAMMVTCSGGSTLP